MNRCILLNLSHQTVPCPRTSHCFAYLPCRCYTHSALQDSRAGNGAEDRTRALLLHAQFSRARRTVICEFGYVFTMIKRNGRAGGASALSAGKTACSMGCYRVFGLRMVVNCFTPLLIKARGVLLCSDDTISPPRRAFKQGTTLHAGGCKHFP